MRERDAEPLGRELRDAVRRDRVRRRLLLRERHPLGDPVHRRRGGEDHAPDVLVPCREKDVERPLDVDRRRRQRVLHRARHGPERTLVEDHVDARAPPCARARTSAGRPRRPRSRGRATRGSPAVPVEKLSRTRTSSPRSMSACARFEPMKPAPPVTRTRVTRASRRRRGSWRRASRPLVAQTRGAARSSARPSRLTSETTGRRSGRSGAAAEDVVEVEPVQHREGGGGSGAGADTVIESHVAVRGEQALEAGAGPAPAGRPGSGGRPSSRASRGGRARPGVGRGAARRHRARGRRRARGPARRGRRRTTRRAPGSPRSGRRGSRAGWGRRPARRPRGRAAGRARGRASRRSRRRGAGTGPRSSAARLASAASQRARGARTA